MKPSPFLAHALALLEKEAKKTPHVERRIAERTPNLRPSFIPAIEAAANAQQLKAGKTYHSPLPGGGNAVLQSVGKPGRQKHVVKTVLSPSMTPPGMRLSGMPTPEFVRRFEAQESAVRKNDLKLWKAVEGLPVKQIPLDDLHRRYLKKKTWGRRDDGGPNIGNRGTITPGDILQGKADDYQLYQHRRLIAEADTKYPIVMRPDGRVLDGVHRIMKAKQEGKKTLPAVTLKTAATNLMYTVGEARKLDPQLSEGRLTASPGTEVFTHRAAKKRLSALPGGHGIYAIQVPARSLKPVEKGTFEVTRGHHKAVSKISPYKKTAPTPRGVDKIKAWRAQAGSVGSSHLDAVKYDKGSKKLQVLFRSGALYEYDDVSARRAEVLSKARSKGKYFHEHIRSKPYSYRRLA